MTTVLVGSGADAALAGAAASLPATVVVRPADLSRVGWSFDPADPLAGTFVASSQIYDNASVERVICTISVVQPGELVWFDDPDDRLYASSEMTALLRSWIEGLPPGVVLGAPNGRALVGCSSTASQWSEALRRRSAIFEPRASGPDWISLVDNTLTVSDDSKRDHAEMLVEGFDCNYLWIELNWETGPPRVHCVRSRPTLSNEREREVLFEVVRNSTRERVSS